MAFLVKITISKTDTKPWLFQDPAPPTGHEELAQTMQLLVDKIKAVADLTVVSNTTLTMQIHCATRDDFNRLSARIATFWTPNEATWIEKIEQYHTQLGMEYAVEEI